MTMLDEPAPPPGFVPFDSRAQEPPPPPGFIPIEQFAPAPQAAPAQDNVSDLSTRIAAEAGRRIGALHSQLTAADLKDNLDPTTAAQVDPNQQADITRQVIAEMTNQHPTSLPGSQTPQTPDAPQSILGRAGSQLLNIPAGIAADTAALGPALGQDVLRGAQVNTPDPSSLGVRAGAMLFGEDPNQSIQQIRQRESQERPQVPMAPTVDPVGQLRDSVAGSLGSPVQPPKNWMEKYLIDLPAGLAKTAAEIGLMKNVMPENLQGAGPVGEAAAWELQNRASGGTPGTGALMGGTVGAIGNLLPGAPIRAAALEGAMFGGSTYLATGDVKESLVNALLPAVMRTPEAINWARGRLSSAQTPAERTQAIKDVQSAAGHASSQQPPDITNDPATVQAAQQYLSHPESTTDGLARFLGVSPETAIALAKTALTQDAAPNQQTTQDTTDAAIAPQDASGEPRQQQQQPLQETPNVPAERIPAPVGAVQTAPAPSGEAPQEENQAPQAVEAGQPSAGLEPDAISNAATDAGQPDGQPDYESLTFAELRAAAKDRGIDPRQSKSSLIESLSAPPAKNESTIINQGSGYDLRAAQPLLNDGVTDPGQLPPGDHIVQGRSKSWEITVGRDDAGRPIIGAFREAENPAPAIPAQQPSGETASKEVVPSRDPAQPGETGEGIGAKAGENIPDFIPPEVQQDQGVAEEPPIKTTPETSTPSQSEASRTMTPEAYKLAKASVQDKLNSGKPVPRPMLQRFAGEDWADQAIASKTPARAASPDSLGSRKVELMNQLRDQVANDIGPSAISKLPDVTQLRIHRGELPPRTGVTIDDAITHAQSLPEEHPARLTLHNLEELQKNPRGTPIQKFNTSQVEDGSRVVVNPKETLTIDREEGVVKDGITSNIPDGGIDVYGKKLLPPKQPSPQQRSEAARERSFNPADYLSTLSRDRAESGKIAPYEALSLEQRDQIRQLQDERKFQRDLATEQLAPAPSAIKTDLFGKSFIDSSGVGEQSPMFHEPNAAAPVKSEPVGSAEANKPENTGKMFGEGPSTPPAASPEFSYGTDKESPTSIRNATVDQERTERGLKPAMQTAQRSFGDVWDAAMKEVDKNPAAQDDVINELRSKPRAVTDREDALLLHRQIDLQNQYDGEAKALEQAQTANDPEGVAEHRVKVAALSDKLLDLYNINKKVGTETGRGLNARKMLAQEDFTLASMETKKRAANQGQELTPMQKVQLKAQHENIVKAQTALDEYTKEQEATKQKSLERQIEFLNKRIAAGDVAAKQKAPTAESKIITELKTKRDALSKQMKSMREGDPAAKAIVNQISLLEKRIATGEAATKTKPITADTKALAELKAKRDLLNAQLKASRGDSSALNAYKSRTMKQIGKLGEKVNAGDFSMPDRTEIKLDEHALQLKAQLERYKQMFTDGVEKDRLKQRTPLEKTQDTYVKLRRAFLLSSPVTLAKLTSAAAERMIFAPAEEAVGGGISKVFPKLAAGAPRQGGMSVEAEAKSFTDGLTKGMRDAWQTLRTGKSDLDVVYGDRHRIPQSWLDYIGNLHGALKAPVKRSEFARSVEKRSANAIRNGLDPHDPLVMARITLDAYKDAQASIFMQDNRAADMIKAGERALERPDADTGKPTMMGKAGATAMKVALPIVKVPTNIVAETLRYAAGLPVGAVKIAHAYAKGIDSLEPQQRDAIMDLMKKGSVGAAALVAGYMAPDHFGGYYQPGEKRDEKDVKAGGVRIGGYDIPSFLVHNPLLATFQLGATIRRVKDSYFRKRDKDTQGLGAGTFAAATGLAEEVPFVQTPIELAKLFDPKDRGPAAGNLARDLVVPEGVQFAAQQLDKTPAGEPIIRKPETVGQHIESGIPGLRENVPAKNETPTDPRLQQRSKEKADEDARRLTLPKNIQAAITEKNHLDEIGFDKLTPAERARRFKLTMLEINYKNWQKAMKEGRANDAATFLNRMNAAIP